MLMCVVQLYPSGNDVSCITANFMWCRMLSLLDISVSIRHTLLYAISDPRGTLIYRSMYKSVMSVNIRDITLARILPPLTCPYVMYQFGVICWCSVDFITHPRETETVHEVVLDNGDCLPKMVYSTHTFHVPAECVAQLSMSM